MFSEAYIIFSLGLTKPLQKAMFPTCFASHEACSTQLTHVQNYIQLCGIIVGEWVRPSVYHASFAHQAYKFWAGLGWVGFGPNSR
jgi:hypothetical protein